MGTDHQSRWTFINRKIALQMKHVIAISVFTVILSFYSTAMSKGNNDVDNKMFFLQSQDSIMQSQQFIDDLINHIEKSRGEKLNLTDIVPSGFSVDNYLFFCKAVFDKYGECVFSKFCDPFKAVGPMRHAAGRQLNNDQIQCLIE